jgi:hypothetical protein
VLPSTTILKKIQIVLVSDTDRRFDVTGVIFGDQLFIFDGVFSRNNSVAMSQLVRATASGPAGKEDALDLATLYLALSYYRSVGPERVVARKRNDSTTQGDPGNSLEAPDTLGVAHSPEVFQARETYTVDFYAYDVPNEPSRGVSHWKIDVSPDGLEEGLSAHHDDFRPFYSRSASVKPQAVGKVVFSPVIMGNGFSDDGATTDLQSWGSSDGPGVQRVHYYYKSHEPAEKRMQDYLHNAVAVVESGPWLDSEGKSVGAKDILIRTANGQKSLFASDIREDATSVLEISCSSLGNLFAVADRELPDWKH